MAPCVCMRFDGPKHSGGILPAQPNGLELRCLLTATPVGPRALVAGQFSTDAAQERDAFPKGWTKVVADKRIGSLPSAEPAYRLRQEISEVDEPSPEPLPMEMAGGRNQIEPVKHQVPASDTPRVLDQCLMHLMHQQI